MQANVQDVIFVYLSGVTVFWKYIESRGIGSW